MKKIWHILWNILFYGLILLFVAGAVLFGVSGSRDKDILGYRALTVLSGSMQPELKKGDLILVKTTPPEEVQVGDILSFYPDENSSTVLTHRVISTMMEGNELLIQTQGDAVDIPDPVISGSAVIGVETLRIPFVGGAALWAQQHLVLALGLAALLILLFSLPGRASSQSSAA